MDCSDVLSEPRGHSALDDFSTSFNEHESMAFSDRDELLRVNNEVEMAFYGRRYSGGL